MTGTVTLIRTPEDLPTSLQRVIIMSTEKAEPEHEEGHLGFLPLIFLTFFTFAIAALIRVAVMRLPIPLPHNFLTFIVGVIFGFVDNTFPELDLGIMMRIDPLVVLNIVIPIIMFEAAFYTNIEAFKVTGTQIFVLVFLNFGLSVGVLGLIVTHVFVEEFDWIHAVLLISFIVIPGPTVTIAFLKRLAAAQKLQYFLEAEALVANCLAFATFRLAIIVLFTKKPGIVVFCGSVISGSVFGGIVAKGVAYWMSKIVNDSVNQVCIVIASLYFCYLLGKAFQLTCTATLVFTSFYACYLISTVELTLMAMARMGLFGLETLSLYVYTLGSLLSASCQL